MKNVLLLIHDDVGQEARLQCALDLTRAIGGHLTCVDVSILPRFMDDYISMGGDVLLVADEQAREARNRARVEARLAQEDVPWNWIDVTGELSDCMRKAARLSDVIVVNAKLDHFPHREMAHLAGELIVKSGRPLLAVPQHAKRMDLVGPAMIAWDGSPAAEAAMRASLPLLALADSVTLIEIEDGSVKLPAETAAAYLSRHWLKPVVRRVPAIADDVGTVLLNEARAGNAAFMVMGGFTHGRLIESVFGGVTRQMFAEADIPLFLAH
ncbi:MAG TPA: universal stress protein [Sphingomonas sp.]